MQQRRRAQRREARTGLSLPYLGYEHRKKGYDRRKVWHDVDDVPVLLDDCPDRLEKAKQEISRLKPKADRWDVLQQICTRLGLKCTELIRMIEEKIRWRNR